LKRRPPLSAVEDHDPDHAGSWPVLPRKLTRKWQRLEPLIGQVSVEIGSDAPTSKERIVNIMAAQMQKHAADASAAAASKTSFAAFGNLLFGALFAAIGGSLAVQRRFQNPHR
jgi:hypothetical protein